MVENTSLLQRIATYQPQGKNEKHVSLIFLLTQIAKRKNIEGKVEKMEVWFFYFLSVSKFFAEKLPVQEIQRKQNEKWTQQKK